MVSQVRALLARFLPEGALLVSALTFVSYATGLARDRVFARTYGAGSELDAYNAAFVLPELALDVLVASGLTAPFVPVFSTLAPGGPGRRGPLRPDRAHARGAGDGRGLPRPARRRPVDRGPHRARLRCGRPRAVPRPVPADAPDADPVRRLDHARRGAGRGATVPVLRPRADPVQRRHRRGDDRPPRVDGDPRRGGRRGGRRRPAPRDPASSASRARRCRCGRAWTCGRPRCASSSA